MNESEVNLKEYLERYCHKYKCTSEEALEHAIVKEIRKYYFECAK